MHLATIIYAVRGGLTAAEVLGRTHGNAAFLRFLRHVRARGRVHAPIGLRNIFREWTAWRGASLDVALALFAAAAVRSACAPCLRCISHDARLAQATGLHRRPAAPPLRHCTRDLPAAAFHRARHRVARRRPAPILPRAQSIRRSSNLPSSGWYWRSPPIWRWACAYWRSNSPACARDARRRLARLRRGASRSAWCS